MSGEISTQRQQTYARKRLKWSGRVDKLPQNSDQTFGSSPLRLWDWSLAWMSRHWCHFLTCLPVQLWPSCCYDSKQMSSSASVFIALTTVLHELGRGSSCGRLEDQYKLQDATSNDLASMVSTLANEFAGFCRLCSVSHSDFNNFHIINALIHRTRFVVSQRLLYHREERKIWALRFSSLYCLYRSENEVSSRYITVQEMYSSICRLFVSSWDG